MQFSRNGHAVQVVRITGPAHNLLRLELGTAPGALGVRVLDGTGPTLLGADQVAREVLNGVADANAALGTSVGVRGITYVASDSPPTSVYRDLARALIEHLVVEPA